VEKNKSTFDPMTAMFIVETASGSESKKVSGVERWPDRQGKKKNRFTLFIHKQQGVLVELFTDTAEELEQWLNAMEGTITGDVINRITWHEVKGDVELNAGQVEKRMDAHTEAHTEAWDAGASSVEVLTKSRTAPQGVSWSSLTNNRSYMMGLSHLDTDADFATIDFALACNANGTLGVFEKGVSKGEFEEYSAFDMLAVMVQDETVTFHHKGKVFYTSTTAPTFPLVVDTSFYHPGARAADLKIEIADCLRKSGLANIKMDESKQEEFRVYWRRSTAASGLHKRSCSFNNLNESVDGGSSVVRCAVGFNHLLYSSTQLKLGSPLLLSTQFKLNQLKLAQPGVADPINPFTTPQHEHTDPTSSLPTNFRNKPHHLRRPPVYPSPVPPSLPPS
jgi:hypothetical protein